MGINRKIALWILLLLVVVLAIFVDAIPFINSMSKLDLLSKDLERLEKYTSVNNKLVQKQNYYSSLVKANEKIREFEEFLVSNSINYSKKDNVIEFNGTIYSSKFEPLIEMVQNSSDLVFLEFKCDSTRELPIAFGTNILETLKISGKVKYINIR
ncbi:MAG: hypothetical protein PWQ20_1474 [Thermotogaceae bacterium]|jgi:hypothetical protein|nr:hypothetical protein [Thermotogaceae bacterium]MDN5338404.1 hypothetical protein [Thermotogaceae bacterium]